MFKQFWSFLLVALSIYASINHVESQTLSGVSWIYAGEAQQNNSALTFNLYDTLNLICRATGYQTNSALVFAISKGTTATGMVLSSSGDLTITNVGTLIWSDFDGIQKGYENFIIYSGSYQKNVNAYINYDYRYLNVGVLKTTDSGTYVCTAGYVTEPGTFDVMTSGSLTITVNTQSGQAHSSRQSVNSFLTYSAAILGASKLVL